VQDKAYLTSFLPLENESIWPGRLDAYLRPIPLKDAVIELPDGTSVTRQVPDPDKACTTGDKSSCHLWNAGEEILEQAASAAQIVVGDYNLGAAEDERRVYYGKANGGAPFERLDFARPQTDPEWADLLIGMDICPEGSLPAGSCAQDADNRTEAIETLDFFHQVKQGVDPRTSDTIEYLLGDIFHSDPAVMGNPDAFRYWVADVAGSGTLPLQDVCTNSPDGYRCFFAKQQFRLTLQWNALKAFEDRFWQVNPNGLDFLQPVANPDNEPDDFVISRLTFQARYRWEIAPLSDLFVVYTRGSNLPRDSFITFQDLLEQSWNDRIVDSVAVKLRYRF